MFLVAQAFPKAAAFVLCFCQHAELRVRLAGHHLAHSAQPAARDSHRGVPQTPRATCSTGRAEKTTRAHEHTLEWPRSHYSIFVVTVESLRFERCCRRTHLLSFPVKHMWAGGRVTRFVEKVFILFVMAIAPVNGHINKHHQMSFTGLIVM